MFPVFYSTFALLFLCGGLITLYALYRAVPGYEDRAGFHLGRPPARFMRASFISRVRILKDGDNAWERKPREVYGFGTTSR